MSSSFLRITFATLVISASLSNVVAETCVKNPGLKDSCGRFHTLLCKDPDYKSCTDFALKPGDGRTSHCWNLNKDLDYLNDAISSVNPDGGTWNLFTDPDCKGHSWGDVELPLNYKELKNHNLNDVISSISVTDPSQE
ncbi:hypothetical protein M3J09_003389 [Ascochyta lentis]